ELARIARQSRARPRPRWPGGYRVWVSGAASAGSGPVVSGVPGRLRRNVGGLRIRLACSKPNAAAMRVGSLHRPPKNDTPIGRTLRAYPPGTDRFGQPAMAAGLAEPLVGARMASRWLAVTASSIAWRAADVAVLRCRRYVGSVRSPLRLCLTSISTAPLLSTEPRPVVACLGGV